MKEVLKVGNLITNKGEKKQGFVDIYNTSTSMPITLINGEKEGKTILITGGVHGSEYPCIQTVIELAKEIEPKDVSGNIILIHPVNTQAFEKKVSAVVPEDNKNINRVFPGKKDGSIAEKIAHFITYECQGQSDFYIDLHGGDLHELVTDFVYCPGIGDEKVIEEAKEVANVLDLKYVVKSKATTGAYNSAAIRGLPSLLIERGGRGTWSKEEVEKYKKDVRNILNHIQVLKDSSFSSKNENSPIEITNVIYLNASEKGCWYPEVKSGDKVKKGDLLGTIKNFFGETIDTYYSDIEGVILYMTVSLSIEKNESLIAYGETN